MRLKDLEIALQPLQRFTDPSVELEQVRVSGCSREIGGTDEPAYSM
jgi:hypothetical protein